MASDLLKPGLELVFCGYNPSLASGRSGYHYAHPGNRFWRVLFAAGITGGLYRPEEDARLLEAGIGVYRWFRATSKVGWGVQERPAVPGVTDVVVPSPSGLNRMTFDELVEHYRVLTPFLA